MTDANTTPNDTSNSPYPGPDADQSATVPLTPPAESTATAPATATSPATATATADAATLPRSRPLFPTILWGALMLALAAFIAARELVPGGFDLVTWMLTAVVGIGLLLVVAGIVAASRRAG